jgi:hypothetical protein
VRDRVWIITIGLCTIAVQLGGCTSPAPQRVAVPPRDQARDYGRVHEGEVMKPLPTPPERETSFPRPYDDAPIVSQHPPEQRAFIEAYERVGRPRMMIIAAQSEVSGVDYAAVETLLADWFSANGNVTLLSPPPARAATTGPANEPEADVLVRTQINPTNLGKDAGEARIITEAVNTRGGESIGRAVVDVPTPLEKKRLSEATRFIARKLMNDMTESWTRLADGPRVSSAPPPPQAPAAPVAPAAPAAPAAPVAPAPPVLPAPPAPPAPTTVAPVLPPPPPPPPSTGTIR